MRGLTFDVREPRGDHEDEELIRARMPGEQLRVSTNHLEPGADFPGTLIHVPGGNVKVWNVGDVLDQQRQTAK